MSIKYKKKLSACKLKKKIDVNETLESKICKLIKSKEDK